MLRKKINVSPFRVTIERYETVMQFPMSLFGNSRCRVLQGKLWSRRSHCMERARFVTQTIDSTRISHNASFWVGIYILFHSLLSRLFVFLVSFALIFHTASRMWVEFYCYKLYPITLHIFFTRVMYLAA